MGAIASSGSLIRAYGESRSFPVGMIFSDAVFHLV
jgi:hypothetical protein